MKRCWWVIILAASLTVGVSSHAQASAAVLPATPIDVVLLVDESGSLSNADVAREIQAAGTIAQTPLNPLSRVTIIGFGGINGVAPHQVPATVVCRPTVVSNASSLEYLARCVRGLHRRTEAEGDGTDYAAALALANSILSHDEAIGGGSAAGVIRAIFLMTDGGLDVHGDPQYARTGNWLEAAHHAVNLELAAARAAGVQVWALGFGTISASAAYLHYLAASGASRTCDNRPASRPRSIVVTSSAAALAALYGLYASASCAGTSAASGTVRPGQASRVLAVAIPEIASASAISVNKGNPNSRVDFIAPDGATVSGGSQAGSTFSRSGTDTAVEVLRITNPMPGTWHVKLTAPQGMRRSQPVTVTAFWQRTVRVSLFTPATSAQPGEPIQVTLTVLSANGRPVTDPVTLSKIQVQVTASGDGLAGPLNIPVSNAGEGSGTPAGAPDFKGTFTAPRARGTLTLTATAAGYGLHATQAFTPLQVGGAAALLQGVMSFPVSAGTLAGGQVTGQMVFRNQTGRSQQVRFVLMASHARARISAPRGLVLVPPGTSVTGVRIVVTRDSPLGATLLAVKAVSAADPGTVYGASQLVVTVISPPSLLALYYRQALVLLLLILAALTLWRRRVATLGLLDVRGLTAVLHGGPYPHELRAPFRSGADVFRFVIRDAGDGAAPRLSWAGAAKDDAYVARYEIVRGRRTGVVKVRSPERHEYDIPINGAAEPIGGGFKLAFHDSRRTSASGRARSAGHVSTAGHSGDDWWLGEPVRAEPDDRVGHPEVISDSWPDEASGSDPGTARAPGLTGSSPGHGSGTGHIDHRPAGSADPRPPVVADHDPPGEAFADGDPLTGLVGTGPWFYGPGEAQESAQPDDVAQNAQQAGENERFLVCRSPQNVRIDSTFAVMVKLTEHRVDPGSALILVPAIPAEGAVLYVLLDAPSGCAVVTEAIVQIRLPARGDSGEAWFVVRAPNTTGYYRFTVTVLWAGVRGQVLAREHIGVNTSDKPTGPLHAVMHPVRSATPGQAEAGLAVARISARRYLYFLNRPGHTPVHDILTMTADPRSKLKALTSDLSSMARGGEGRRPAGMPDELRRHGRDLWLDFLPGKIREELSSLRPGTDTLTIACANPTLAVPWEMLHPIDPIGGRSDFLVQMFDVVRSPESSAAWCPAFALQPAVIVLPDDQLPGALEEARAISELLGAMPELAYVREKIHLQRILRDEPFGLLHVVAHDRDGLGTISLAARQKFAPSDLNEHAGEGGRWSARRPLVFINACGTAVSRQRFTQFTSWAQSSFEAGAGGFIGSMWDVRSETASAFAWRFYQAIYCDGLPFSKALHAAREHARSKGPDPTWLAYAAHGDHSATAS